MDKWEREAYIQELSWEGSEGEETKETFERGKVQKVLQDNADFL